MTIRSAAILIHDATPSDATPSAIGSKQLLKIGDSVNSASKLIEEIFIETGQSLGSSIEILERIAALFTKLQTELDSAEMRNAIEGFSRVSAEVLALGGARSDERAALGKLSKIAKGLGRRIDDIHNEIRTIAVLTINARITASGIGAAGSDFLIYISEIGQSLKLTETNLQRFRNDLMQVSEHLRVASVSETEFDERHAKTASAIPRQLAQSLELITARRHAAATAAGSVTSRSRKVTDGIARVVMAMQIGDATRQRMEHVQEAAELIARIVLGGSQNADPMHEPWQFLSEADRLGLAGQGCSLLAAQLADTAEEFNREIASVHSTIGQLSADAHEIVQLGKQVFGSSGRGGAFLKELETDVQQTHALFGDFHDARTRANRTMDAVLGIVSRLNTHIDTVRTIESDIRIMGVNAMLKSSRLGTIGAALRVVAQEVTNSSGRTAAEAKSATADVQDIVVTARSLASDDQSSRLTRITAVTELMDQSTAQLRSVADGLAAALTSLAEDGLQVATLLDRTSLSLATMNEINAVLKLSAAEFDSLASAAPSYRSTDNDTDQATFNLIAARYTMIREREIHARYAPLATVELETTEPAPQAAQTVDDMLF